MKKINKELLKKEITKFLKENDFEDSERITEIGDYLQSKNYIDIYIEHRESLLGSDSWTEAVYYSKAIGKIIVLGDFRKNSNIDELVGAIEHYTNEAIELESKLKTLND